MNMSKTDVVLVYPQRAPVHGRHWIMPSLGLMYLSASLRQAGYTVRHIDHTFLERRDVLEQIDMLKPSVIGIYCMITMQDEALSLAAQVRDKALTVVGGPYPSGEPETFVDDFDLVAVGEGEETIVQIMRHLDDRAFDDIPGLVFKRDGYVVKTEGLHRSKDMSHLPLPYRGDIPNHEYIAYWRKHWKDATTPYQARGAVTACVARGIMAAGFFMVGYLGETTDSLIRSINFSSSLPLDYVSYTIAYPLPGTGFYERVRERRQLGEWHKVRHNRLLFNTDFPEHKLRAAILKGAIQHRLNKLHMKPAARAFELATDPVLRALR